MTEVQLILGLVAALAWAAAAVRILRGSVLGERGVVAVSVCIATSLVILVFGSLFLLHVADGNVWFVTGTGLRVVVAVAGLVALVDQHPEELREPYAEIAETLRAERQDSYSNLAGAIAENTRLTQRASDNADARADHADQQAVGEHDLNLGIKATGDATATEVHDIHTATVGKP